MADSARRPRDKAALFQFDMSLLAALLDRWCPETHTFHLPVGEMTPTLQDVAMLLGLPCAGGTVGAEDVALSWRDDLLARFAGVQRNDLAMPYRSLPANHGHGPTKRWLLQFSIHALFHIATACVTTTIRQHRHHLLLREHAMETVLHNLLIGSSIRR